MRRDLKEMQEFEKECINLFCIISEIIEDTLFSRFLRGSRG
jgi:hypothetical protein